MKNPLVTAVIAAHNEEKYLHKSIESLINQNYFPVEIIIVDNCSTDNTYNVIKEYKKKYPQIKILKIKGVSRGPGAAWNLGAEKARGKILMLFGADLYYGKNYISDLIRPILLGKEIGTIHYEEKIGNLNNLWARAFSKIRILGNDRRTKIFSLIRKKDFFKYGPLDIGMGYADDQTLNVRHGLTFLPIKTKVHHFNPDTAKDAFNHAVWVGQSYKKPWQTIIMLPVFPIFVIIKVVSHLKNDFFIPFIFFLPVYYTVRYFGYFIGAIKRLRKNDK